MAATVTYHKAFAIDEFTNMVNAQIKCNGKLYAVSVTCAHWFEGRDYLVKYIKSFRYLIEPSRKSRIRDAAIKDVMKKIQYSL